MIELHHIIKFIEFTFEILHWAIIIRILMSWLRADRNSQIAQAIYSITEPILGFFRNIMPRTGMIDLSPIIALISLSVLEMIILNIVKSLPL